MRLVLVRPRNSLNIGAAARAMANFGLDDLVLVAPYADAWRAAVSARAGTGILARARVVERIEDALAGVTYAVGTTAGTARVPQLPLEDWPAVAAALPREGVALLFGSERTGLSVDDISHCRRLARIPTLPDAPSMNLGQAVAVCAYEWARCAPQAPAAAALCDSRQSERILAAWYPLLERVGLVLPQHRGSQMRALRQLLLQWQVRPQHERRLLGMARQFRIHLAARDSETQRETS